MARRSPAIRSWLLAVLSAFAFIAGACSNASNQASPPGSGGTIGQGGPGGSGGGAQRGLPPVGDGVVLPDGRIVRPAGDRFDLGDFALGAAVSPDGRLAVSASNTRGNGLGGGKGSYCTDTGKTTECPWVPKDKLGDPMQAVPDESLSVVDLQTGKTTDVVAVPTVREPQRQVYNYFSLGLAFSPDGQHLYATGGGNDAVYDFTVKDAALQSPPRTLVLPSTVTAAGEQPIIGKTSGFTKTLALTQDGKTLLVVKEYDSDVTVIDTATMQARQVVAIDKSTPVFGAYLYGIALAPDNKRAYVTAQGTGTTYVLSADEAGVWTKSGQAKVGDHPTAVAVTPDGQQVLVANANDDTVSILDVESSKSIQTIKVRAIDDATWGSIPNALAISKDSRRAFVALAGENAVAVLDRGGDGGWKVSGFVPTGWYPAGVTLHPNGDVIVSAAKGLGSRYPKDGRLPKPPDSNYPQALSVASISLDVNMPGVLSRVANPDGAALDAFTRQVRENIRFVTKDLSRSERNPVPARSGDPTPIKNVIYIVRENRTYDQVFGDLGKSRTDVDADPSMEFLAPATPNAHKIQTLGSSSDRFFSNGEASIQGHWWTAGAAVSDYTEKSWRANYSNRARPYDFVVPVAQTRGCTVFDAAQKKSDDTKGAFTFRDYGEPIGFLNIPAVPSMAGSGDPVAPCPQMKRENFSTPFLNQITDVVRDDRVRVKDFLDDIGLDENGNQIGDPATQYLRNFSYLTMPQDHTTGLGGTYTPRAQIAQNDVALGMVVSAVSRSKYWKQTAIVVIEDDSSDGTDHVDGHRNILLVASPYAKHVAADGKTPGYMSHQHIDQASVVRTIGLLMGWDPISSFDQLSLPLFDQFQDKNDPSQLTPADLAPYDPAPAPNFLEELAADYKRPNGARLRQQTATLNYTGVDRAGPLNEAILWHTIRDDPLPAELQYRVDQARSEDPSEQEAERRRLDALCAAVPSNPNCAGRPPPG